MTFPPLPTDPNNPYYGMQSLLNEQGQPYQVNPTNGKPLPHLNPRLPNEEKARAIPPLLLARLQHTMSQVQGNPYTGQPLPPNADPRVGQAASSAKVKPETTLKATSSHSFKFNGQTIFLNESYTPFNSDGVAFPREVDPSNWETLEKLLTKYLQKEPSLLPQNGTVTHLGFTSENDEWKFEIYFKKNNTLERAFIQVDGHDIGIIQELAKEYPALILPSFNKKHNMDTHFSSEKLKTKLNCSHHALLDTSDIFEHTILQSAFKEAEKLKKSHAVSIHYPFEMDGLVKKYGSEVATAFKERRLLKKGAIEFQLIQKKLKNGHAKVFNQVKARSKDLKSNDSRHLAKNYPLHFVVNAQLGTLDEHHAPATKHFESVVITTHDKQQKIPILLQQNLTVAKIDGVEMAIARENLFKAITQQAAKYSALKESVGLIENLTILENIHSSELSERDLTISVFVRIAAIFMVNSKIDATKPLLNLTFEYAKDDDNQLPPTITTSAILLSQMFKALEGNPSLVELIEKFLEWVEIEEFFDLEADLP